MKNINQKKYNPSLFFEASRLSLNLNNFDNAILYANESLKFKETYWARNYLVEAYIGKKDLENASNSLLVMAEQVLDNKHFLDRF